MPFLPTGPTEMVGTLPATRAQRGMQAASRSSLSDVVGRVVGRALEAHLGYALPVERMPGAGGQRAMRALLDDVSHRHSLLLVSEAVCVHAANADPALASLLERLRPVATCIEVPYLLVVRNAARQGRVPGDPVEKAIGARAAAPPFSTAVVGGGPAAGTERLCTIGSAGYGGRSVVLAQAFAASGVNVAGPSGAAVCRELAFNGGAAALQALLGGQIDAAVLPRALAGAWLDNGSLMAVALPDSEQGLPPTGWFGVMAGPAWPAATVSAVGDALLATLAEVPQRHFLRRLGLLPLAEPGPMLADRIRREQAQLRSIQLR